MYCTNQCCYIHNSWGHEVMKWMVDVMLMLYIRFLFLYKDLHHYEIKCLHISFLLDWQLLSIKFCYRPLNNYISKIKCKGTFNLSWWSTSLSTMQCIHNCQKTKRDKFRVTSKDWNLVVLHKLTFKYITKYQMNIFWISKFT